MIEKVTYFTAIDADRAYNEAAQKFVNAKSEVLHAAAPYPPPEGDDALTPRFDIEEFTELRQRFWFAEQSRSDAYSQKHYRAVSLAIRTHARLSQATWALDHRDGEWKRITTWAEEFAITETRPPGGGKPSNWKPDYGVLPYIFIKEIG